MRVNIFQSKFLQALFSMTVICLSTIVGAAIGFFGSTSIGRLLSSFSEPFVLQTNRFTFPLAYGTATFFVGLSICLWIGSKQFSILISKLAEIRVNPPSLLKHVFPFLVIGLFGGMCVEGFLLVFTTIQLMKIVGGI